jgi:phosphonate transport system substrate-binding protein
MKKLAVASLSLVLAAGIVTGCGTSSDNASSDSSNKNTNTSAYTPKELNVQFVPSQNADTIQDKVKPLEKLLSDKLGIPVHTTVSTDYTTIIEAMKSKQVDVGFLPPTGYVLAHQQGAADVLLQTQRYGVKEDGTPDKSKLVDYYRAEIVVRADSGIKQLSDLKGKKIAFQGVASDAGYVFPAYDLKKAGVDPTTDMTAETVKGHDKAVLEVYQGHVDAAAIFEDARQLAKTKYKLPDLTDKVVPIYYSEHIPNDTVTVRPDMDNTWKKKIQDAFIQIGQDPNGRKVLEDIYSIEGFSPSDDSKFNIIREYHKGDNK